MPLPGVCCPSGGTERGSRDGGSAAGPGSPPRRPAVPLCGMRERGARLPLRGSSIPSGSGRGAPAAGAPAAGFGVTRAWKDQGASSAVVPAVRDRPRIAPRRVVVLWGGQGLPGVPLGGCCGTPRVFSTSTGLGTIKFPIQIKNSPGDGLSQGFGRGCGGCACSGFWGAGWEAVRCGALPRSGRGWLRCGPAGRQKSYGAFLTEAA